MLLVELEEVLRRPKFSARLSSAGVTPEGLRQGYAALALVIPAAAAPPVVDADPDDDVVLACAVAANADLIVTGDQHLLALKGHSQISICTAMEALTRLDAPGA